MQIIKEPNKILHKKLERVDSITPKIKELILDMIKTMEEAGGVGLSANQVGKDLQIFIINKELADDHNIPNVFINPEITEFSKGQTKIEEGCLSIPGYWAQIKRAKKIRLKALNENGDKIKIKMRGFLARVIQHEVDHLQGILIKDYKNNE